MLRTLPLLQDTGRHPRAYWLAQLALLAGISATCLLSLHFHEDRFSGFDVSPMIDGGWRVYLGQAVNRDFIGTFPQSLNLSVAAAYRLFGLSWRAIGVAASLLTALLCLAGMRLTNHLRSTLGDAKVLFLESVYVLAQLTTLIYINYLWHASMSQQIGIYAVLATVALVAAPDSLWRTAECVAHLLVALPLLVLSKPNTALPAVALCFLAFWVCKRTRFLLLPLAIAVLLLSSLLLHFAHTNLLGMLLAYKGLTGRLVPKPLFIGLFYNIDFWAAINVMAWLVLIPLLAALLPGMWSARRNVLQAPMLLLAIGSVLVSLLGFCTNFDFKMTDCPMLLFGAALFLVYSQQPERLLLGRFVYTAIALAVVGFFLGQTRARMQVMGQWAADACGPRSRISDPFFNRLKICPAFPEALAEVDHAVQLLPPHAHVFFGSSLEFLYVRERLNPPLGLPVWWDPGTSYPLSAAPAIAQAFRKDHFDLLVVAHGNPPVNLPGLADYIQTNFALVPGTSQVDVYRRIRP